MSTTRKPRVPMSEQLKLINECRKSGLTDADWCRNHQIAPSTFYNWISRCRKACADQIVEPKYGHSDLPRGKQDVVPVTVVSDSHADYLPDPNRYRYRDKEKAQALLEDVLRFYNIFLNCIKNKWKVKISR